MQMLGMIRRLVNSWNSIFQFGFSEFVICVNKNRHHSIKGFDFTAKTTAPAGENRDVVAQIGIDPFDGEGVVFVSYIADMPSRINDIYIACIAVGAIILRRRGIVDDRLDPLG